MKKTYLTPDIRIFQTQPDLLIATSGVSSNNNIGYGGVDAEGEFNPSVKDNSFEFEWE